jgi:hypothetical protein
MSVQASSWAFEQSATGLTSGAKFLLVALANHATPAGVAWPGRQRLAEECICEPETVSRNLSRLEELGLIQRVQRRRGNGSRTSDWVVLAPGAADRGPMGDGSLEEFPEHVCALARSTSGDEESPDSEGVGQVTPKGSPEPLEEPSSLRTSEKTSARGFKPEPITFGEWIGYHCIAADRSVPRAGTTARAKLAEMYAALEGEGYSLDDLKLASDGVLANGYMVEHGYTKPENVLRKEKIAGRVDDGRRARAVSSKPLTAEEQRAAEWREQQRVASEYQPDDPYADDVKP